jgi:flagellar basal-body rod modification protein FlgD
MSLASVAAAQSNAASSSSSASNSASSSTSNSALNSLSSNFNDFLTLLTTQLQNQDPSSPMDANTFTSELVEFASVQQQIDTNTSLTQLIQLTQAGEVMQSSAMEGKQVAVSSTQLALQNGSSEVQFNTTSAEPVAISITNSSGVQVASASLTSQAGTNSYTWNGEDGSGVQLPDGAYTVAVTGGGSTGTAQAIPFNVIGTVTGVTSTNNAMQLQMGALTVPFSAVQAVE